MKEFASLGKTELEVVKFVQEKDSVSVREAALYFADTSGLARTTVLTVMERLRKKGILSRKKHKNVFHYSSLITHSKLTKNLIRGFVDRVLGGRVTPFLAYLADDSDLTVTEREDLKKLVSKLEQEETK